MLSLAGGASGAQAGFGSGMPNCSDKENAGSSTSTNPSGEWLRTHATNLYLSYGSDDKDKRKSGKDTCAGLSAAQDVGIQLSYALLYYMPYAYDSKRKLLPLTSKSVAISYTLEGNQVTPKEASITLSGEVSANASVTIDKKGPSATIGGSTTVGASTTVKFKASRFFVGTSKNFYPCVVTKKDPQKVWIVDCRFTTGKTDLKWSFPGGGITSVVFQPTAVINYGKGKTLTSRGYLTK